MTVTEGQKTPGPRAPSDGNKLSVSAHPPLNPTAVMVDTITVAMVAPLLQRRAPPVSEVSVSLLFAFFALSSLVGLAYYASPTNDDKEKNAKSKETEPHVPLPKSLHGTPYVALDEPYPSGYPIRSPGRTLPT